MAVTKRLLVVDDPVDMKEVAALLKFATERGLDPVHIKRLYEGLQKYSAAVAGRPSEELESESALLGPEFQQLRAEIADQYSQLAKLTLPVTGRTLVQTEERFPRATLSLKIWTLVFLFLAVGNEILKAWLADIPEPEEGTLVWLVNVQRYVLEYSAPFMWGALGSLAYLLKRLSDVAEDRTFDSAVSHGWAIRIFLGGMLGGIIQFIYDPQLFSNGENVLKANVIALGFLTGVGVKVVYGAIEKTIDVLAMKLNLEAIRGTKVEGTAIQKFLNEQLSKTDKGKDPEKRQVLLALLSELPADKK